MIQARQRYWQYNPFLSIAYITQNKENGEKACPLITPLYAVPGGTK